MSRPTAPRTRRRHLPAGLAPLLALFGVFACSDSSSPTTGPGGTTAPTCSVTLSAPEAVPGSELVVSGLEAAAEARGAVFSAGGAQSIAPVRVDEAGALRVMVPLHPAGAAGGAAQMTLYVGERGCHPVDVRIQALVAAPGTTEAMLDNLDHAMAEMARISGVDPEALEGDPSRLPPHLTPILLARRLLSDPNNPNSVRAMLAGTAPALEGTRADAATLDALLASSGAAAAIQELADSLAQVPEPPAEVRARAALSRTSATRTAAASRVRSASAGIVVIRSAEELDYWMRVQKFYDGFGTKEMQRFSAVAGSVAALLSLSPVPHTRWAGVGLSVALYATNLWAEGHKTLLPSKLDALEVSYTLTRFNEGDGGAGEWYGARLTASGERWSLTLPTLIDGLLNGMGALDAVSSAFKTAQWVSASDKGLIKNTLDVAVTSIVGAVNTYLGVEMAWDGIVGVAGPYTYGPVDVQNARWTSAFTDVAGVVEVQERTRYAPVSAGKVNVVVATVPSRFAGQVARASIPVEVVGVFVTVQPGAVEVRPGGTYTFHASVENAVDGSVAWSASAGSITADGHYTAPATEGTYTVTAASTAKPERKATATVTVVDKVIVRLTPARPVTVPGGTVRFSATVEGAASTAVTWSASRGTLSASGQYTAPRELGTYTVTATSVADPSAQATASVLVSEEPPSYTITDLGSLSGAQSVIPRDLNNAGQIVGTVSLYKERWDGTKLEDHGFHWQNGSMRALDVPPAFGSTVVRGAIPNAINDRGEVAVQVLVDCNGKCRGGVYSLPHLWKGGVWSQYTNYGVTESWDRHYDAFDDLNNWGEALVTRYQRDDYNNEWRLLFVSSTVYEGRPCSIQVGSLTNPTGLSLNDRGSVLGYEYSPGYPGDPPVITPLFCQGGMGRVDLGGFQPSTLNNQDELGGRGPLGAGIWSAGGVRSLPALAGAAPGSSTVYALSDLGDAVGVSGGEPVVWKEGRVHPLRALIPQESGWQIDSVVDINDQGWMIGVGTRNGASRAFVMRPQ